jgi:hypothetical protein
MANKKANNKYTFSLKGIRNTVKSINKFFLDTTESVLEETIERAEDWQLVGQKAITGGIKVVAKQQDLMFDALEVAKKQLVKGKKRVVAIAND